MKLTFGAATLSATVSLWHTPGRPGPGQKLLVTTRISGRSTFEQTWLMFGDSAVAPEVLLG